MWIGTHVVDYVPLVCGYRLDRGYSDEQARQKV